MVKKVVLTIKKDRNPHIAHMRFRKSGVHEKTKKAQRRADKVKLRKEL